MVLEPPSLVPQGHPARPRGRCASTMYSAVTTGLYFKAVMAKPNETPVTRLQ
jgi:hypothetical protein